MSDEVIDAPVVEDAPDEEVEAVDTSQDVSDEQVQDVEVTEEVEASDSSPEKETPKKDGVQKRFDKLTTDIYDLKGEIDYWKTQAQQPVKPETPIAPTPLKTLADFEYDELAYSEHVQSQAKGAAQREYAQQSAAQSFDRRRSEFSAKGDVYAEDHDDFRMLTANPALMITPAMAEVMFDADKGQEVYHHLAKNEAMTRRLSRMPYQNMVKEMVKIEANLSVKKPVVVSKTPAPAPKIDALDPQVEDGPGTSQKSFEKWRQKQIAMR